MLLVSDLAEGESFTDRAGVLVEITPSSSEELTHPLVVETVICKFPSPAS